MIKIKKHLSLKPLVAAFKKIIGQSYRDNRRKNSVDYNVVDTVLSVLACMFYKAGSLLRYQRVLEKKIHRNNLKSQFGVDTIPSDNQIRSIIASTKPEQYAPIFKHCHNALQRAKYLKKFSFLNKYLVAIDATQYFESNTIHCPACLTQTMRNGTISYSHKALQPIICHPDQKQILPMMPEPIENTDGQTKQDCEINAAKRLMPKLREQHSQMNFIWLADSLYATAPFIQGVLDKGEDYIFRVKKGDHRSLFSHLETANYNSYRTVSDKHTIAYRWYENVPLNDSTNISTTVIQAFAIKEQKDGSKSSTRIGVWITTLDVNENTIVSITTAARARWKVENQCFNLLKNYGYELGHNWGHVNGESFIFYIIIMLAFFFHQIFELTDQLYQLCRKICVTYKGLWDDLLGLFKFMVFPSWEAMLLYCIKHNGGDPPQIVYE